MSQTPHTVIKASAGTGKTYRLSIRILRLLALGEAAEGITALTFTRAAAAEFLTKVVERLSEACASEKRHREICADAGLDPDAHTRESFAALLGEVMVDSNRLTLGTLDSFFARLVNTFPLEVGIETGAAEIIEEYNVEGVITEVACALLAAKNEESLADFSEKLRQLAGGKSKANPTAGLIKTVKELHEMYVTQDDARAWGDVTTIWGPSDQQPDWIKEIDLETLKCDIGLVAQRAMAQMDKEEPPAELRDAKEAIDAGMVSVAMSKFIEYFKDHLEGLAQGVYTGGLEFGRAPKGGVKRRVFANEEDAQLIGKVFQSLAGILVRERLSQTQAAHACLRDYEREYDRLARRKGRLTYADYVRLLNENLLGEDPDRRDLLAIHYRMDSQVRHLLLDEFQDTSTSQYEALDPYIREVLAKADDPQSLFVVGDPKQSLYEWRKGNRRLLDTVVTRLRALNRKERVEVLPLNETRRCSAPVLNLTNRLLDQLTQDDLGEDFPSDTIRDWNGCYMPQKPFVDPDSPTPPKLGEALWVRFERQPGRSRVMPSIRRQARWIAWHLRQREGTVDDNGRLLNGLTCAILVRTNEVAKAFAEELRSLGEKLKIDANDESAVNPATDNPVTASLLAVAKATLHPRDTMARGLAEMSPAARSYVSSHGGWESVIGHVADLFHKSGAEALVHDLCLSVKPEMLAKDNGFVRNRLGQLRSLAESYDQSGERTLGGFIRHCEGTELRGLADRGAVQVITTHRSKGLEYDMVYMPMPDGGLAMAGIDDDNILALYPRPEETNGADDLAAFRPTWLTMGFTDSVGRVLEAIDPLHLGKARQRAMGEQGYGNLCNLYVGITRARHRIVLLSDCLGGEGEERSRRYQVNHLLHKRLGGAKETKHIGPENDTAEVMFSDTSEDSDWLERRFDEIKKRQERRKEEAKAASRTDEGSVIPAEAGHRRPLRNNPSRGDHTYAQPSATEDLSKPVGGKSLGNRVHDLLAHLEWDIPGFIRWMESQKVPRAMESVNRTAVDFIKVTLADETIARSLSQGDPAELLWIERKAASFQKAANPAEKDVVTVGSFDRVHIVPGKRALVLDYKTARADKSTEDIKKAYVDQMTAYRASLHAMTGIPLEAIACKLIVVRAKPCVIDMNE